MDRIKNVFKRLRRQASPDHQENDEETSTSSQELPHVEAEFQVGPHSPFINISTSASACASATAPQDVDHQRFIDLEAKYRRALQEIIKLKRELREAEKKIKAQQEIIDAAEAKLHEAEAVPTVENLPQRIEAITEAERGHGSNEDRTQQLETPVQDKDSELQRAEKKINAQQEIIDAAEAKLHEAEAVPTVENLPQRIEAITEAERGHGSNEDRTQQLETPVQDKDSELQRVNVSHDVTMMEAFRHGEDFDLTANGNSTFGTIIDISIPEVPPFIDWENNNGNNDDIGDIGVNAGDNDDDIVMEPVEQVQQEQVPAPEPVEQVQLEQVPAPEPVEQVQLEQVPAPAPAEPPRNRRRRRREVDEDDDDEQRDRRRRRVDVEDEVAAIERRVRRRPRNEERVVRMRVRRNDGNGMGMDDGVRVRVFRPNITGSGRASRKPIRLGELPLEMWSFNIERRLNRLAR